MNLLLIFHGVVAFPSFLPCSRSLTEGTFIMSRAAHAVDTKTSFVGKQCDGTYTPGETLRAKYTGTEHERILQITGASFEEGSCSNSRYINPPADGAIVNTAIGGGTIELWSGASSTMSSVAISQKCKLNPITNPPPSPITNPPPPPQVMICDIAVIGHGIAGQTAALISQDECGTSNKVCLIGPGYSTSLMAGGGTYLLPRIAAEDIDQTVAHLQELADADELEFDAVKSKHALEQYPSAFQRVEQVANLSFVRGRGVGDPLPCNYVARYAECGECGRVENAGEYPCRAVKQWYRESGCCNGSSTELDGMYWKWKPTYYHIHNAFNGSVVSMAASGQGDDEVQCTTPNRISVANFIDVVATKGISNHVDTIKSANQSFDEWNLVGKSGTVYRAKKVIFGTGGFGNHLISAELAKYGILSVDYVHAPTTPNGRMFRDLAEQEGWRMAQTSAWYLDHTQSLDASSPSVQWFLWNDGATVLSNSTGGWKLVYNEAKPYDMRGHISNATNFTDGWYFFKDATNGKLLSEYVDVFPDYLQILDAIEANTISKRCDTRSTRYWHNAPTECGYASYYPGDFSSIPGVEVCEQRITATDKISFKKIYTGLIDTTTGPVVDKYQKVVDASNVYAVGNAAAPAVSPHYIGPGSTLGNALYTGYIAAINACNT